MSTENQSREVEQLVNGTPTSDGAGVKLLRVLTQNLQRRLDPFLMLDEFRSDDPKDYIAGFPNHPHRGFQTVTYMLAGRMRHQDSAGNEGLLTPGGVQWMNTGRGLVHSEIPEQEDGLMHGFQLWVNLPSHLKMSEPGYRDIPAEQIPAYDAPGGVHIRVIAGDSEGTEGAVQQEATEPLFLDLRFSGAADHTLPVPADYNAFIYVYEGALKLGDAERNAEARQMAVLSNGGAEGVRIQTSDKASALLIAGRPLRESIAQWGPFVMNTREEVEQAMSDYQSGVF
ncbi:pirin family protein [Gilvimarinus sp. F26214L]|uniref:pirin family protein n=1 Tax=Gilvimarinus sp. DZF01 TaxID=3461371 RepID=UPI004045ED60